ncbi:hypothetical protein QL093DRAFT_2088020 [Fusarium oxysporum]|nr:hypothetical protein QL093DRAFT_2088020 [Fusarium oxysporum]
MNGAKRREALSSGCIVKCMLDAYSNEGHALAVRMSPKLGFSDWFASNDLDAILKGDYELVVVPWFQYDLLLRDDVAVETPLSGGKIDDKCALDALSAVEVAGYKVLAWRPHFWNSRRDSNSKKTEELRLCMRHSNEVQRLRKAASRSADQLQRSRKIVQENVKELSFLYRSALSDSDHLHERYETEYASNGQSRRLLKIAGEMKEGYVEIEKAHMAIFEAEEKMEAAEQNLLQ